MRLFLIISAFFVISQAQFYNWYNLHSCNSCFEPNLCYSKNDNLSEVCSCCLQETCKNEFEIQTLASEGMSCIQRARNDPSLCKNVCPDWTRIDSFRVYLCTQCLTPCIGTLLDQEAGQCTITTRFSSDPCVSESKKPCGTCYRANSCFTMKEFDSFGGICRGYLQLKCNDFMNITCLEEAFSESCSGCPRSTLTDGRFQACKVCINRCEEKRRCLDGCKSGLTTFPKGASCPLCRSFCQINPFEEDCESQRCNCTQCDECYDRCQALPGDHFNLFNPCLCLNEEENAPVIKEERAARILGGSSSCDGDWPWIAYIYLRDDGVYEGGICGGTLFNNQWIITAAHCLETDDPALYSVILGEHDVFKISGREVYRNVTRIKKHPSFDYLDYSYDVAVLELDKPVMFNQYIQPLAIAPPGTPTDKVGGPTLAGGLCTTIGWGLTSSPGGRRSRTLNQLSLRITPAPICLAQTLTGYEQGPVFPGSPKFCAGAMKGEDSCEGDSGGPLFCLHNDGNYVLHGVTSYGTPVCGENGKPGVYTEVANVSTWINMCVLSNNC